MLEPGDMQSADVDQPPLGQVYNPLEGPQLENPYPVYARARREEPVFFSPMLNAWIVTRYEDIKSILQAPQRFSSVGILNTVADYAPATLEILGSDLSILTHGIVNVDPPRHTRIRASLTKAFSAQRIARYEPVVRQAATQMLDQFSRDGRVNLVERFNYPFPALVTFCLMGVPPADLAQVQAWAGDWIELLFARLPPERQITCAHSAVAYLRYIEQLIEQRRTNPQEDITSDLIMAINSGEAQLSREELVAQVFGLVLAANDTTAGLLGNCLNHILSDRSHWQNICENPGLIPNIVEETLRFNGSALCFFRVTTEAIEMGGVSLPEGAHIILVLGSANHDETQFPEPETFNPQRQNVGRHMGFGYGIHFCLGAPLARLTTRVALELLSTRLPSLRLMPDQVVSYRRFVHLRTLTQLLVEWDVNQVAQTAQGN